MDIHSIYSGLNSVFAAAIVNRDFREMLLRDPRMALKQGYLGKGFALSREEALLLTSIHARSLAELAREVVSAVERQTVSAPPSIDISG